MAMQLVRRLGIFALTAAFASVLVFALLSVLPGDPARIALGVQATAEEVARERTAMGLDAPAHVRYGNWVWGMLHGDMGESYLTRQPVGPEIFDRLQVTLWVVGAAMVVALVVAIPLGVLAAVRRNRADGVLIGGISQVGIAIPAFLAGVLLVTVFAVELGWLPSSGWQAPIEGIGGFLSYLTLPALALGLVQGSVLTRYVRSAVLDELGADYLRTARAKGLTRTGALLRHGLRNAAVPVVTVAGLQLATLLIGAVVVERVFVVPGLGSLLLDKVGQRDMAEVQSIVMVLVLMVLLLNLVVDLLYTAIDPRMRSAA
ncbi:binding-protein-dependent transport system inner membrane component family protein [Rhodococcus sp. MTM3W5.2]|uniref:ABC transporter permease n=1 Tax=Rhodococcus sp. MTM3W5.2 TaxID=1805827 RepID=UPI0009797F7B|nr:ABC transporter permease [Rhodococcus sp. MTM3W5.2]AQA26080.1 binding-protein-dependent transport system inner membrane component family protein [Rhodococcus sp. MTM3W5.2]